MKIKCLGLNHGMRSLPRSDSSDPLRLGGDEARTRRGNPRCSTGFTIIELLVVIAIMIVGGTVAMLYLATYRSGHDLDLALDGVVAVTRDTQNRSVTQQDGKQWGIRFSNGSVDKYEVFSGPNYASGTVDRSYNFRQGIVFSEPTSGSVFDAIFESLTGRLNQHKIISLITGKSDSLIGDIIINSSGLITTRIEKNLIGYWHLDEGTGINAFDASGQGYTGTITAGAGGWTTGKISLAYDFDGIASYITLPASNILIPNANSVTITIWAKGDGDIISGDYIFGFQRSAASSFLSLRGTTGQSYISWIYANNVSGVTTGNGTKNIDDSAWHFYAFVRNGSTITGYIDGVQDYTNTNAGQSPSSNVANIGALNKTPASYGFDGRIDDVRVYNRVLSTAEILQLYNDLK